jgi:hypothetical protein
MGEIAEMMLDGTLCASCGEYIGSDNGYPTYCSGCGPNSAPGPSPSTAPANRKPVACPSCGKRFKTPEAQTQHFQDRHAPKKAASP